MLDGAGVLIGIGIYFAGMIFIGYIMKSKNRGAEDFLVGGRSFNMFFNTGTLVACLLGGTVVIALPGVLYSHGMWDSGMYYGGLISFGGVLCLVVCGLFFMKPLWKMKLLSLGDYYYQRFGKVTGVMATVMIASTFIFWIAVQILTFAKVGTSLIGLSLTTWVIIAMAVICSYTVLGGLWAVCVTDIVQVIIVAGGLLVLTPIAVYYLGDNDLLLGWSTLTASIPAEKVNILPEASAADAKGWMAWIAAWMVMGLGSVASPDLLQRAFSANSGSTARNSALVAAAIVFVLFVVTVILSFTCISMIAKGNLGAGAVARIAADSELLIPVMFQDIMPVPLVATFLGACLSAVMSAAATANIALSGLISKNIIKDLFLPRIGSRSLMQLTRIIIVAVGIFAAYLSLTVDSALTLTNFGFDLILSCLFIPLAMGLYWKKANGYGAVAAMIGGIAVRVGLCGIINGFTMQSIAKPETTWFYFTVAGPIMSLICMVIVSQLTHKRAVRRQALEEEHAEEWTQEPVAVGVKTE